MNPLNPGNLPPTNPATLDITKLVACGFSIVIFILVVWLIRERRLREKYALLWLGTSLLIIVLAVSRRPMEIAAQAIGIYYPPSLLFLLGLLFLLAVTIGHSITLSRLSETNMKLAQELALLRKELADLKRDSEDPESGD